MIPKTKGDCEFCPATDTQLYSMSGGLMCRSCMEGELDAEKRIKEMKSIIEDSRKVDSNVILKTDVFLAKTTAAVELEAAINQDDSIPLGEKAYALAKESMIRYQQFKDAVFKKREELTQAENEMRMWQVNTQRVASGLHEKYQAEFTAVSVNYKPTQITKKAKTTKPVKQGKSFDRAELAEMCKKYNVTDLQSHVRMRMVARNETAEQSAKHFAQTLGLLESEVGQN